MAVSSFPYGTIAAAALTLLVEVAATKTITAFTLSGTATATVRVDSDGGMYQQLNGGGSTFYETWLDRGSNTEVWVEATVVSGTLTSGTTGSRLACTVDRSWSKSKSSGFGTDTCVIDLDFYDASSGGNLLDTQRVTLNATREP